MPQETDERAMMLQWWRRYFIFSRIKTWLISNTEVLRALLTARPKHHKVLLLILVKPLKSIRTATMISCIWATKIHSTGPFLKTLGTLSISIRRKVREQISATNWIFSMKRSIYIRSFFITELQDMNSIFKKRRPRRSLRWKKHSRKNFKDLWRKKSTTWRTLEAVRTCSSFFIQLSSRTRHPCRQFLRRQRHSRICLNQIPQ